MPWKETDAVQERKRFVTRLREEGKGSLARLCREFGISRKTGEKLKKRYAQDGERGLEDRTRAPLSIPHRTSPEVRTLIVEAKKRHPSWGPKKLRAWLAERDPGVDLPSAVTFGYWLDKAGLVNRRKRRRKAKTLAPVELTKATRPNQVWATDFKGEFLLGNGRYCYPLTITDQFSRYLVAVVALETTQAAVAREVFEEVFREYGLPEVIRSDNGCPFASVGLGGLTTLSTYWLRLGIRPERIEVGHPEQNGQHERFHLTLKQETTRPAAATMLQQQERFDGFRDEFNLERPHEAIKLRPPARLYRPSTRVLRGPLSPLEYPLHDFSRAVSSTGTFCLNGTYYYLSQALAGERVGLREVDPGLWSVHFMNVELGRVDERSKKFDESEITL